MIDLRCSNFWVMNALGGLHDFGSGSSTTTRGLVDFCRGGGDRGCRGAKLVRFIGVFGCSRDVLGRGGGGSAVDGRSGDSFLLGTIGDIGGDANGWAVDGRIESVGLLSVLDEATELLRMGIRDAGFAGLSRGNSELVGERLVGVFGVVRDKPCMIDMG